eukprot:11190128-Lingulodinium_polyedra.AAC.1
MQRMHELAATVSAGRKRTPGTVWFMLIENDPISEQTLHNAHEPVLYIALDGYGCPMTTRRLFGIIMSTLCLRRSIML